MTGSMPSTRTVTKAPSTSGRSIGWPSSAGRSGGLAIRARSRIVSVVADTVGST